MPQRPIGWRAAATRALYGPDGFYRRSEGPAGHFRTAAAPGPVGQAYAEAIVRLADLVDEALGRPSPFDLVDLGAGRGELLRAVAAAGVPSRWQLTAVDVVDRPAGLPVTLGWTGEVPAGTVGLVIANEWLDTVPVDVVVATESGVHLVLVDEKGEESPGPAPDATDRAWLDRWWPLGSGGRAEIGHPRDAAWAATLRRLDRGVAVAVDYRHDRESRPAAGSLAAYRSGRGVRPVPDGTCDITTHVALDACAAAGLDGGAQATALLDQRSALLALGLDPTLPPRDLAGTDPAAYAEALARAGGTSELIEKPGLGGFGWLIQTVGVSLPPPLRSLVDDLA